MERKKILHFFYFTPGQLWKYDSITKTLTNKNADKNGGWEHQRTKWTLPAEGSTGPITDTESSQLLVYRSGNVVKIDKDVSDSFDEQMWFRSKTMIEGYFTLQNPSSEKFLTATSPKATTVTGTCLKGTY